MREIKFKIESCKNVFSLPGAVHPEEQDSRPERDLPVERFAKIKVPLARGKPSGYGTSR